MEKQNLVNYVISQILDDVEAKDLSSLNELLLHIDEEKLKNYLPERSLYFRGGTLNDEDLMEQLMK